MKVKTFYPHCGEHKVTVDVRWHGNGSMYAMHIDGVLIDDCDTLETLPDSESAIMELIFSDHMTRAQHDEYVFSLLLDLTTHSGAEDVMARLGDIECERRRWNLIESALKAYKA